MFTHGARVGGEKGALGGNNGGQGFARTISHTCHAVPLNPTPLLVHMLAVPLRHDVTLDKTCPSATTPAVKCADYPALTNGQVRGHGNVRGAVLVLTCNSGYILAGT